MLNSKSAARFYASDFRPAALRRSGPRAFIIECDSCFSKRQFEGTLGHQKNADVISYFSGLPYFLAFNLDGKLHQKPPSWTAVSRNECLNPFIAPTSPAQCERSNLGSRCAGLLTRTGNNPASIPDIDHILPERYFLKSALMRR
ncbi:hypothetical protein [Noviherbaspirillum pedocola]|uniref:Uncharacterized protein n=1 Tax=Noviherbaspirillum pedocola TaxID=2801341 RepID=A0A934STP5_9BURK|nr:hypothetical protein [Noviherbaspirillum pedocola]MBK4735334.1 hypothetical protein [Noviherbaspirillum pedocola]